MTPEGPARRDPGRTFWLQLLVVGLLLPVGFFFVLQADGAGHWAYGLAGGVVLATAMAAGWSLWRTP